MVQLRVWQALVGRVRLYLLDANDPLNSPVDRGITGKLYDTGTEIRLLQEIVLGVAGWRVVEALAPEVEICHMNEGHAAFAVLERARAYMRRSGLSLWEALWATRPGNLFTTHTPVAAGFDRFPADLLAKYARYLGSFLAEAGIELSELLALGRARPDSEEPFNMAFLAMRGSLAAFGVSRLHGAVSRRIFQPLFPRWPEREVPVGHVTNGVHVPSWDSQAADDLWTAACGKERWRGMPDTLSALVSSTSDEQLWTMANEDRQVLIEKVRMRLVRQLASRGDPPEAVNEAANVLDPNALMLGFARRFTGYKRPNLLLRDPGRLARLLNDPVRPVQLVLAGKAHPADVEGKRMIRDWIEIAQQPEFRRRVVFLEDYDIALAQELVQGIDVWINTPRRPWEACGTSGMKVLVNGGLNLSERDGWWDEAYAGDLGWAISDGRECSEGERDAEDAEALYSVLEQEIVPEFYARDASGIPRQWLDRVRRSMAVLAPTYSSSRMAREYVEQYSWRAPPNCADEMSNRRPEGPGDAVLGDSLAAALVGSSYRGENCQPRRRQPCPSPCQSISAGSHRRMWQFNSMPSRATAGRRLLANSPLPRRCRNLQRVSASEPAGGGIHGANYPRCTGAAVPAELPLILWEN